ncbi:MAG: hypothetical protein E7505_04625 [Ruminococcus sp.]|nr:hypothetical protein [Ruminococcus sp.]
MTETTVPVITEVTDTITEPDIIITNITEITSEMISESTLTAGPVTEATELLTTVTGSVDYSELTYQSVHNIEILLSYFFGMAMIIIVCLICRVIINTFFKGV